MPGGAQQAAEPLASRRYCGPIGTAERGRILRVRSAGRAVHIPPSLDGPEAAGLGALLACNGRKWLGRLDGLSSYARENAYECLGSGYHLGGRTNSSVDE